MKNLITLLMSILSLFLCPGCLNKDMSMADKQAQMDGYMKALKEAKFKGKIEFRSGGNLLGLNAKTNWSLGPENVIMAVDGSVDFTGEKNE